MKTALAVMAVALCLALGSCFDFQTKLTTGYQMGSQDDYYVEAYCNTTVVGQQELKFECVVWGPKVEEFTNASASLAADNSSASGSFDYTIGNNKQHIAVGPMSSFLSHNRMLPSAIDEMMAFTKAANGSGWGCQPEPRFGHKDVCHVFLPAPDLETNVEFCMYICNDGFRKPPCRAL